MLSTLTLYFPSIIIKYAKQNSWLSAIIATFLTLISGYIITKLDVRFPNKTIVGYSPLIAGKILGNIISLIYIIFFISVNAVIIRELTAILNGIFLSETPILIISISIAIVTASAVRNGIEVISRVNELIFPSILLIGIILFFFITPELDLSNFKPILADGLKPILKGSYLLWLFLSEIIILTIIIPTVKQPQKSFKSVSTSIIVLGIMFMATIFEIIGLFGIYEADNFVLPLLSVVRYIEAFEFIARIDPFIVIIWLGAGFMKVIVFYYCSSISTAEFFNLKSYKPVILPLGVIQVALSIILFGNIKELLKFVFEELHLIFLSIEVVIPLILLLIAIIRGVSGKTA
ncbi:GerAB/ArcD/ProY family transporter [Candidatus Frackibacter sp. WG13]|uniref:GerAB/ArcD/ProY family transporter n=1 Tax=Candidatus Frackibacter sp. WG13 TaxID=2017978 RepID=UPI002100AD46|nr:endospore germination permease [Candidatus Frackibacter sp. WG13]